MGKGIARKVLTGKVAPKENKPDGDTQGLPIGDRGPKNGNSGRSIRNWRAGQGSI